MRYTVDVDGRSIEVDVRDGPDGLLAAVGQGPLEPVHLRADPAPRASPWAPSPTRSRPVS